MENNPAEAPEQGNSQSDISVKPAKNQEKLDPTIQKDTPNPPIDSQVPKDKTEVQNEEKPKIQLESASAENAQADSVMEKAKELKNQNLTPSDESKAPQMDEELINPLDQKNNQDESSDLLDSIVATETSAGDAPILEEAPEFDASLLQGITPEKSLLLVGLKVTFAVLLVASFFSILFFTTQLTDRMKFLNSTFGIPNAAQELRATNEEKIALQTDLNFYRYLQLKAYLDEFSFLGDEYAQNYQISNSTTNSEDDRQQANQELEALRNEIRESYIMARDLISEPFETPLIDITIENQQQLHEIFKQALSSKISENISSLQGNEDSVAQRNIKNFQQALNLVGNNALKNLLVQADFDELENRELVQFIEDVNSVIVNDLSTIQEIKNNRLAWSDMINEIELRTAEVDKFHQDGLYDEVGGIRYSSYDFDAESKRISVVGETKRFDATNFSLITNLIDEFNNNSRFFENAEMRSFSKSGNIDEGFIASMRLTFDLKEDDPQGPESLANNDQETTNTNEENNQ